MPEAGDPLVSVGYLLAAAAATALGLIGYAVVVARRLARARSRNATLRAASREPSGES